MKLNSILNRAERLSEVTGVKDIYDNEGKISAIRITSDNSKSLKYLKSNKAKLSKYYGMIKSYTDNPNENYEDAVFVLSYFNLRLTMSGKPIEDRCIFVGLIEKQEDIHLSQWVLDDLIGSTIFDRHSKLEKRWRNMDYDYKYKYILNWLNSPTQKGKKCTDLGDMEMDQTFPPDKFTK